MLSILKKLRFNKTFYLIAGAMFIIASCNGVKEDKAYRQKIAAERMQINEEFFNPKISPLDSTSFYTFKGIRFFPIQEKYRVMAKIQLLQNQAVFELPHSHNKTKPYKNYAVLQFELDGKSLELIVLEQQNKKEGYENYLLLPFTDETNGKETYGAGRYIDLEKVAGATEVEIDFNKAYNPYCAYNDRYTCPIPPKENHIPLAMEAGMKNVEK
jgi:uncharacterized protein (DUF1684 family)